MPRFGRPAIPLGSTILVTGANGFVGSHVIDQLLQHGYRVRGAVRDAQNHGWLTEYFDKKYGNGKLELVSVKDMVEEGAFDAAVKGVAGVAHVAAVVSLDTDAENVAKETVRGTMSALKSAAKEPSVKRFVLTSSSSAVRQLADCEGGKTITADEYNDKAVELAKAMDDSLTEREKGLVAYSAAKTKGERAMWDWIKENKPEFVANSVLPPVILGGPVTVQHQGHRTSSGFLVDHFNGEPSIFDWIHRLYWTNVEDIALLHVAGLIHPSVENERIFAYAGTLNPKKMRVALRELFPDRTFQDEVPDWVDNLAPIGPRDRAETLLKDMGRPGFVGLEDTLKANLAEFLAKS